MSVFNVEKATVSNNADIQAKLVNWFNLLLKLRVNRAVDLLIANYYLSKFIDLK